MASRRIKQTVRKGKLWERKGFSLELLQQPQSAAAETIQGAVGFSFIIIK